MKNYNKMLLINPKKNNYKKHSDELLDNKQINFGLLALKSLYPDNIILYDCQFKQEVNIINEILEIITKNNIGIVGISLISAYSESCAFKIAEKIKLFNPNIYIMYGGKDYVPYLCKELLEKHHADIVHLGEGEAFYKDFFEEHKNIYDCSNIVYKDKKNEIVRNIELSEAPSIPSLKNELYPNFKSMTPYLEISRGCNSKCAFCSNNGAKQRIKPIANIIEELDAIKSSYGENFCVYFQTPHMLFKKNELKELALYKEKNKGFTWRSQTRVEYLNEENLQLLYKAGARVLDIGFESASPRILQLMEKSSNPDNYIEKMKNALKLAYKIGLRLKLNILLYVSDDYDSIMETANFLDENLYNFHAFSPYPLMFYPSPDSINFKRKIEELGGSVVNTSFSPYIKNVNLSNNIDCKKAQKIAILLGKSYQSIDVYAIQRVIGYAQKEYDFNNIKDKSSLPCFFSVKEQEDAQNELKKILNIYL